LVVVFEIDLAQAAGFGGALPIVAPAGQLPAWGAAICPTSKALKFIRRRLRENRLTDLEIPDRGAAQVLRGRDSGPSDQPQRENGRVFHVQSFAATTRPARIM